MINIDTNMTIGIYKIENKINKKIYVGQSINIEKRWKEHKYLLTINKHHNKHLQNAWNKYQEKNFVFSIIEECNQNFLNDREQYWINKLNSYNDGYNLDKGGDGILGYKKGIYRVIKKENQRGDQRYQLINPSSQPIKTSIFKKELDIYCTYLNNKEITEGEVLLLMKKKEKEYRKKNTQGYKMLVNLGIDYLIFESKNGRNKKDIIDFYNIPQTSFDNFLKDNNVKWNDIVIAADMLKINDYDKKYNIQQQLDNGKTINQIRKDIGCTVSAFKTYRKDNNIRKSHSCNGYTNRKTNTGIRHVSYLSSGAYQYRRTKENPNNITRINLLDLEKVAKERNLEWIIDDNDKYLAILKKEKEEK